jgi:signal transduction histidine kinase
MADNYAAMQQYTIADGWYKKTIERAKTTGTPEYQLYAYMGLSDVMLKTKQYKEGKTHINNGIELAQQLGTRLELKNLYLRAAELYEATGNTGEALRWHKQFVALNDSLLNEKNTNNINALEIKYESTKKETQIKQLQSEKKVQQLVIKQKNTVNAILLLVGCSLLAIGWLMYKSHQQKQQLQLGRIAELEKEKKLLATEAMLKGQEEERSRLAKDLHDGLGGMLSGVKFSFSNMKENLIMTPENLQVFQRGLDMLDSSISEMRRVAHSMMPEALLKFGLDAALKDFCTQINSSGVIKILYQSYALEDLQINQTSSVTIYRIVQELINNSIKHSGASQAIVQLNREQNKLLLTVEDNGTGFHKEQLNKSAGVGWANISSRLAYLNASVDLESAPGKGTSVNIEIDIEP